MFVVRNIANAEPHGLMISSALLKRARQGARLGSLCALLAFAACAPEETYPYTRHIASPAPGSVTAWRSDDMLHILTHISSPNTAVWIRPHIARRGNRIEVWFEETVYGRVGGLRYYSLPILNSYAEVPPSVSVWVRGPRRRHKVPIAESPPAGFRRDLHPGGRPLRWADVPQTRRHPGRQSGVDAS